MKEVEKLDFGLSTRCNSACPQCPRTNNATHKAWDWLKQEDLSLEDIKNIVPPEFFKKHLIKTVSFCGGYGDPLLAPELFDILRYFQEHAKSARIYIATNGAMKRSPRWWHQLGEILSEFKNHVEVTFAIDGIDNETHAKYRINTEMDVALRNAQILQLYKIDTCWQFIVFEHNKHQLEEAESMSKRLNFTRFSPILANRRDTEEFKVPKELVGKIPQTRDASFNHKYDNNSYNHIDCISDREKEVHIPANGFVTPCCFLDERYFVARYLDEHAKMHGIADVMAAKRLPIVQDIETLYGIIDSDAMVVPKLDAFNTIKHGLEKVLAYDWWDKMREDRDNFKINKCNDICGKCSKKENESTFSEALSRLQQQHS